MKELDIFSILILLLMFVLVNVFYRLFPKNNDKLLEKITKE